MWFYQKLKYLEFVISEDGKCDEEIEQRVGAAAKAVGGDEEGGAGKTRANEEDKAESIQCHGVPTLIYGCETWTMQRKHESKIQAYKWCSWEEWKVWQGWTG